MYMSAKPRRATKRGAMGSKNPRAHTRGGGVGVCTLYGPRPFLQDLGLGGCDSKPNLTCVGLRGWDPSNFKGTARRSEFLFNSF